MLEYQTHAYPFRNALRVFLLSPSPDSYHTLPMMGYQRDGYSRVPVVPDSPGHARHLYAYPPSRRRRR